MAMFGGSSLPGGFHADVMDANPTTKADKQRLADEIKNRAKGSLASKNFLEASTLYGKAISVMTDVGEDSYLSILYSNRSMCELGMGKAKEAETDAANSIRLDPHYVKAYYRRGAALSKLGRWADARDVLQEGLQRKPDDKDLQAQLDKVIFALSNPDSAVKPVHAVPKARSTITTSAGASTSVKPTDMRKKATAPAATQRPVTSPERTEDDDEDSTQYRGYKMTSDGRKTTFFNNELDSQTKELIGDIAPKKLAAAEVPAADTAVAPTQGSAWNQAGTFESKDFSKWGRETLTDMIQSLQVTLPGAVIKVTDVTVTGDGEVVAARGKRKHIYDYTAVVKFSVAFTEDNESSASLLTGELTINDIDADEDSEYEVTSYAIKGSPTPQQQAVLSANVRSGTSGFQPKLFEACDAFRKDFKAK